MEPFVERLVKEYYDLNEKIVKLHAFMHTDKYYDLPVDDQEDLSEQFSVMTAYSFILGRRLKRQGYNLNCEDEENN